MCTHTFTENEGCTTLTLLTQLASKEVRDAVINSAWKLLLTGAVLLAAFGVVESRRGGPLLDFVLFSQRRFVAATIGGVGNGAVTSPNGGRGGFAGGGMIALHGAGRG